jgi:two-component system NtrC family response regulator
MLPKLLIVDDDPHICRQAKWMLADDFTILIAGNRQEACTLFKQERPAVVTLDLGLPPYPHSVDEGFHTLRALLQENPLAKIIIMTGQDDRKHAIEAIELGAYDFFHKPLQFDELKILLRRALHVYELEHEAQAQRQSHTDDAFEGMLGTSPQMQEVFAAIRRVATTEASVLIRGESGTGKELVAQAIHRRSARSEGPFIAINCGAIPDTLLESELFGHEKGAFTGAQTQRQGRFELAHGGTLFLDEVAELSLPLQVKLLRFLQEHQIERVGGRKTIDVDTRVLAATNVDLGEAMRAGSFRDDLYYRLGVVEITLPPLRERGGDLELLAKALLRSYAAENPQKVTNFDREAIAALYAYDWPGNVRELENRIRRAVIMATGSRLTLEDLGFVAPDKTSPPQTLQEVRATVEGEAIQRALRRNRGNITHTAAELDLSRPTLRELMRKYGLRHSS